MTEVPIAVAITAPVSASTISVPAPVPVTATLTTGLQTTVKSVTYYANGTAIGQSLIAPFNIAWQLALPGTYTLTATAISDTGASYTSAPITVTAVTTPGSGYVTYFHDDLTGNTIAATDASGNVVYTEQYRPYGERLTNDPASKMGQLAGNRIWFHGKAQDEATGLQYFGARYYDPAIGRFMGVDSAGFDPGNLHSFNRYAYGNNNPYRYFDPNGLEGKSFLDRAVEFLGQDYMVQTGVAMGIAGDMPAPVAAAPVGAAVRTAVRTEATVAGEAAVPSAAQVTAKYDRNANYGGSQTNSPAAKAARAAGEGQPCPTCGKTQTTGTPTAPSPQHQPSLVEHYYEHGGHAMTDAQRRAYARKEGINGTQCITCQRKEGADKARYSQQKAKEHGL